MNSPTYSRIESIFIGVSVDNLMIYTDGNQAKIGDHVLISGQYRGVVVANMDDCEYSTEHPKEQWSYLQSGVMIDTDFGGLVHYEQDALIGEIIELVSRS